MARMTDDQVAKARGQAFSPAEMAATGFGRATFSRSDRDGERTLTIVGDIDMATKTELEFELANLVTEAHSPACVDLRGVSFMDTTAINALLGARRSGGAVGIPLVVTAASRPAQRVLEICGVWDLLFRPSE